MFFDRAKPAAGDSFSSDERPAFQEALESIQDELRTHHLKLKDIAQKMAPWKWLWLHSRSIIDQGNDFVTPNSKTS